MCAALSDAPREVNVLDYVRERADQIAQLMAAVDNVEPIGGQVRVVANCACARTR